VDHSSFVVDNLLVVVGSVDTLVEDSQLHPLGVVWVVQPGIAVGVVRLYCSCRKARS